MHEIHPSLQSCPSPQVYHRTLKCFRRFLMITCLLTLPQREHRLVEVLGQASPVLVSHRPHHPNNTPESTVPHRRSQMQRFIRRALVRQLCCVTSSQEGKFHIGELRSNNVHQCKLITPARGGQNCKKGTGVDFFRIASSVKGQGP